MGIEAGQGQRKIRATHFEEHFDIWHNPSLTVAAMPSNSSYLAANWADYERIQQKQLEAIARLERLNKDF